MQAYVPTPGLHKLSAVGLPQAGQASWLWVAALKGQLNWTCNGSMGLLCIERRQDSCTSLGLYHIQPNKAPNLRLPLLAG